MKSSFVRSMLGGASLLAFTGIAAAADLNNPPPAVAPTPFFLFSDTTLGYRLETQATDPGNAVKFPKNILNVTHVDGWLYGTNFFSIDALMSTNADPAAPATVPGTGQGSVEVYSLYRGTLSGNALTHSKMFSMGPVKDISLGFGGDINTQNTVFAPQKRDIVVGPQISFDVPGYLTIEANAYKEWNHNGIAEGLGLPANPDYNPATGGVNFRWTAEFETDYMQPLTFTGLPLSFSGFTNVVLPKGVDGFNASTKTELLTSDRLVLDAGALAGHPKLLDVFVGYKYWLNKFGNNAHTVPGSIENQVYLGMQIHLQ